ncbi:MAG: nuoJ [Ilumatobacteraceae bacterium]|nr:nuoJ [Ilumatobacteraceae bacterium]
MQLFVFICAAVMILAGAVGVIVRSHPVHAALSLVLTLFGVAVMFVSQDAHFLAAVEVIVYGGAIVVLFLFVIMLLGVDRAESLRIDPVKVQRPLAVIVGLGLFGLIGGAIIEGRKTLTARGTGLDTATDAASHDSNIKQLANDLFSNHVFAFEVTSVLLVIAVVGTVLLARRPGKSGPVASAAEVAARTESTTGASAK